MNPFLYGHLKEAWEYGSGWVIPENCRLVFGEQRIIFRPSSSKIHDYFVSPDPGPGHWTGGSLLLSTRWSSCLAKGIYERNDGRVRELEGLPAAEGLPVRAFRSQIIIRENGIQMHVDLGERPETGYFFGQLTTAGRSGTWFKGASYVLGAFCYTGSFETHAVFLWGPVGAGLDISGECRGTGPAGMRL